MFTEGPKIEIPCQGFKVWGLSGLGPIAFNQVFSCAGIEGFVVWRFFGYITTWVLWPFAQTCRVSYLQSHHAAGVRDML